MLQRIASSGLLQNVVRSTLVAEILCLAHNEPFSGHQGVKKTLQRILQRFWWPTIKDDVTQYTHSCDVCVRKMSACTKAQAPLKERQQATQPLENIEIDIKGPLPKTDNSAQYIFIIQDTFSQFAEMHAISRQTTEDLCGKLLE